MTRNDPKVLLVTAVPVKALARLIPTVIGKKAALGNEFLRGASRVHLGHIRSVGDDCH